MARARNLKPSIFKNELLGVADPLLTILFESLWCLADRRGRLEDRPLRIKAETFPYREGIDINGYLTDLSRLGFILRYKIGELSIIQIVNFEKHQNPHHTEKESELPEYSIESNGCLLTVNSTLNNGINPADSLLLIPDSLNTDSLIPSTLNPSVSRGKKTATPKIDNETEIQSACKETWKSYTDSYFNRYGVEPVRNAKVNSMIKQLVQRLGYSESPHVAYFYVNHNNSFYVGKGHSVEFLLKDCEKLRTEWATNKTMTNTRAKQIDKTDANKNVVAEAMAILESKNAKVN